MTRPDVLSVAAPIRILVVNDREDQLLALQAVLEPLGHQVVTALSGDAALRHLLHGEFAVILLDVNMPGMNGFEIAEASRLRPQSEQTPVIFVTASSQAETDLYRGYDTGAFDFVHVPVAPAILRAKVEAFVRLHRLHCKLRLQAEDLARLNAELHARTRQLAELNEDLVAFSYSVSHDLRAPLRRIDHFGDRLAEGYAECLDSEGRRLLERIRGNASDMGKLIEALLALARIGRTDVQVREVDLGALARHSLDRLQQEDPVREVEVVIPEDLTVRADPALVRILLDNLLANAWKFSAVNLRARIEVGMIATFRHPRACFVRDDGAGFDPALYERLFHPFQRLHTAEQFAGVGIGLSIVARIVARHGGQVWAESQLGQGATFYFTFD
jgi:hypothetical protein